MPGYEVSFGALQTCVEEIAAVNSRVVAQLEALRQQVNAQLPNWDGEARTAWAEVDAIWRDQVSQMSVQLNNMQNFVNNANVSMQSTEARNAALVGGR